MGVIVTEQPRVGIIHLELIGSSLLLRRFIGRVYTLFDLAVHLDQILDALEDPARLTSSPATDGC